MERTQHFVKNGLLAFVLISVGFAFGKHSVRRVAVTEPRSSGPPAAAAAALPVKIRVYYLHATFRCVTCNTIEKMTRELLERQFGKALADGRIEWREDDFQENESLAKRFDVISSCVVVAKMRGEKVLAYQRLDEVWTLMDNPVKFNDYVGGAIRAYLPEAAKGSGK